MRPTARRHERNALFIFFLQLRDTLHGGRLYVFSILVALTWVLWAIKLRLSRRYTPWVGEHETTASVVIPVVDEPVGLFHERGQVSQVGERFCGGTALVVFDGRLQQLAPRDRHDVELRAVGKSGGRRGRERERREDQREESLDIAVPF